MCRLILLNATFRIKCNCSCRSARIENIVFTNLGLKTMQIWKTKDDKVYTITKYCRRGRLPN